LNIKPPGKVSVITKTLTTENRNVKIKYQNVHPVEYKVLFHWARNDKSKFKNVFKGKFSSSLWFYPNRNKFYILICPAIGGGNFDF